jgi:radical SAM protein with 4Fe4S-binding SPASM domain
MCPREDLIPAVKDMDLELFKKVIDEGEQYVEVVAGMYLGEPLLNPQIFDMVRYCKQKGLRVLLSTNATTLNQKTTDALLSTGLDYLILSFDGASPETYEQYRLGADFDKVRDNIVNFLKRKHAAHAKTHCTVQMVLLKENISEIEEFTKQWKDVEGVDDLRYKPNMVLDGDFAIPRPLTNPAVLKKPCLHLWRSNLVVRYDGVAFPCCWSYGALPIGDLRKQSLEEVWNSPAMVELRKKHVAGRADEIPACRDCSMVQPSAVAIGGAFLLNAYSIRKALPVKDWLTYMKARIGNFLKKIRSGRLRPDNASAD